MPYIREDVRERVRPKSWAVPDDAGGLNYQITMLIRAYMAANGENYRHYNDVLGVLSAVGHELYRRKIAPYEDKKIEENGDVY